MGRELRLGADRGGSYHTWLRMRFDGVQGMPAAGGGRVLNDDNMATLEASGEGEESVVYMKHAKTHDHTCDTSRVSRLAKVLPPFRPEGGPLDRELSGLREEGIAGTHLSSPTSRQGSCGSVPQKEDETHRSGGGNYQKGMVVRHRRWLLTLSELSELGTATTMASATSLHCLLVPALSTNAGTRTGLRAKEQKLSVLTLSACKSHG